MNFKIEPHVTEDPAENYGFSNYGVSLWKGASSMLGFRYRKDAEECVERIREKYQGQSMTQAEIDMGCDDGIYFWYCDTYGYEKGQVSLSGRYEVAEDHTGIIINVPEWGESVISDAEARELIRRLSQVVLTDQELESGSINDG